MMGEGEWDRGEGRRKRIEGRGEKEEEVMSSHRHPLHPAPIV